MGSFQSVKDLSCALPVGEIKKRPLFPPFAKEAFQKRRDLSTSGIITETRDEKTELQERLKELKRQKGILKTRDVLFEKDHEESKKRVKEQKRSLEKIIAELSGVDVKILLN